MKLKLDDVLSCFQVINKIMYDGEEERKLPFKIKLRLSKMKDVFSKTVELYESQRIELIRKYGDPVIEKDKEGNEVETGNLSVSDPEKLKTFVKEINEILSIEEEFTFDKIPKDYLTSIEDVEMDISERDIKTLFTYLTEEEEE